MQRSKERFALRKWLPVAVHIGGLMPLIFLLWAYFREKLGFNPVQTVLHRTGRTAVVILFLSLACTPINNIFKQPEVKRLRKPIGLYAALYAVLHFAAFAIWDYGLNFNLIWGEISEKPFIIIGVAALIILVILAATSFRFWRRILGKRWVWLHQLVYMAGALVVVHYLLAVKGDLFSLQGTYAPPLIAGGVLMILFVLRLPSVHRPLRRLVSRE